MVDAYGIKRSVVERAGIREVPDSSKHKAKRMKISRDQVRTTFKVDIKLKLGKMSTF